MNMSKLYVCCFLGHRKICESEKLNKILYESIEDLIVNKNVNIFLFGSKSQFDKLCLKTVTDLKEKYPHIKRIYVRSSFQYIDNSYKDYLLESYDDTYYPEQIKNSEKASYVERNREMIDRADFCVVYYDKNYLPPLRRNNKCGLLNYQLKSGTKIAYDYAVKKQKEIINIFDIPESR